ncbi:protein-lysine N-methyltransferase EEF2KMT isoform X1 [Prionailurus iriomotensis]
MAPEESTEAVRLLPSFERRFLAARALRSFPWQSLEEKLRDSSGPELLLDILQKTVKHPLCVKHPPSVKYARCFLSELIRKHEAVHTEPLDELYEALAEVLRTTEPTQCHRSYLLSRILVEYILKLIVLEPSGDSVTLSESTAIISHGTTGLVTWDAALYLAEWAMQNPAAFAHRTVLELGSGAGLTGLAICKTCRPSAYIFSDCHSCVLEQLRGNILLNGLSLEADVTDSARHPEHNTCNSESPRVTVAQLDWDVVTAPQLAAFQPEVVIAAEECLANGPLVLHQAHPVPYPADSAVPLVLGCDSETHSGQNTEPEQHPPMDVLYCPETVLSLVRVLQRLSACLKNQQAPDAYIAFTVRNPETCQLFTSELGIAGIPWEAVPHHDQKLFPYEEHSEMAILKLTL